MMSFKKIIIVAAILAVPCARAQEDDGSRAGLSRAMSVAIRFYEQGEDVEAMDRFTLDCIEAYAHPGYPQAEAVLLIELEGEGAGLALQLDKVRELCSRHGTLELRLAKDAAERDRLWEGRRSAYAAMSRLAPSILSEDGVVPRDRLAEAVRSVKRIAAEHGVEAALLFHAGDGNMHPLILFDANKPGDLEKCEAFGAEILKLCVEVGGCLTGEHGVGIEKRDLMSVQFDAADMEAQMRVKDVFDPKWLLNPAKVFPLGVSETRRAG